MSTDDSTAPAYTPITNKSPKMDKVIVWDRFWVGGRVNPKRIRQRRGLERASQEVMRVTARGNE